MESIAGLHPMFHLGAFASVTALALRNQLQLRLLLLVGLVLYIADEYVGSPRPEWPFIVWNALFFVINLYVVVGLVLDRTTFGLSPEEKDIFKGFLSLSPGQFRKLIRLGRQRVAEHATPLTVEGVVPDFLFYVFEGTIELTKSGRAIGIEPPAFIGEIAFLRESAASASVSLAPGGRYLEWPAPRLRRYLARNNAMRIALNRALSDDLAVKLARS